MNVIFDIDGTVADTSHRLHHIRDEEKNWPAFFDAMVDDAPIEPLVHIARLILLSMFSRIYLVTGRPESHREQTVRWLEAVGIHPTGRVSLHMRKTGDYRPDYVIKKEWFDALPDEERSAISMAFEDRSQVVNMWRECGILVAQVADGGY